MNGQEAIRNLNYVPELVILKKKWLIKYIVNIFGLHDWGNRSPLEFTPPNSRIERVTYQGDERNFNVHMILGRLSKVNKAILIKNMLWIKIKSGEEKEIINQWVDAMRQIRARRCDYSSIFTFLGGKQIAFSNSNLQNQVREHLQTFAVDPQGEERKFDDQTMYTKCLIHFWGERGQIDVTN